jgi:uncharacterized protein YjiS (DUF1127 family)
MLMITARSEHNFASPYVTIEAQRGILRRMLRGFVRALAIRHSRQMLRAIPDWLLHDIGVTRAELDLVAQAIVNAHDPRGVKQPAHASLRTGWL